MTKHYYIHTLKYDTENNVIRVNCENNIIVTTFEEMRKQAHRMGVKFKKTDDITIKLFKTYIALSENLLLYYITMHEKGRYIGALTLKDHLSNNPREPRTELQQMNYDRLNMLRNVTRDNLKGLTV